MTREEFREAVEQLLDGTEGGGADDVLGPVTKWAIVVERSWADGRSLHLHTGGIDDQELTIWDTLGMHEAAAASARAQSTEAFQDVDEDE